MQSLSSVIKDGNILHQGEKRICTKYDTKNDNPYLQNLEEDVKQSMDSYESIAKALIDNGRRKADIVIQNAFEQSEEIKRDAFDKAYEEGKEKGFNDAYEEGYKKNIEKAHIEAESIINKAKEESSNMLMSAKDEYLKYIKDRELEIKNLIVTVVENVLNREAKDPEALDEAVFQALNVIKSTSTFIIKTNSTYCESLKNKIEFWKEQLPFKGDIFVVLDNSIKEGNAEIQRDNGKITVSIDYSMEKVREAIFNR
ncbi:MAG: flagellar assembly protein FliH [Clostridiaceae bacterium]|jgi:flagellar assembly protein FliH|nr:flagellar assembly protein FliH [Clostridiaceae bacterium]